MDNIIQPKQKKPKIRGKADIILCVDGTGSMTPTREGLIENLNNFADNLKETTTLNQSPIDWRAKFYVYRDIEVDSIPFDFDCPWVSETEELKRKISEKFIVEGGGDAKESTFDAIHKAITKGEWEDGRTRILIVFTDADTKPLSTDPTNGILTIAQTINEHRIHTFLFAPETDAYKEFESTANNVIYTYEGIEFGTGLKELPWDEILKMAAKTISQYSVSIEK